MSITVKRNFNLLKDFETKLKTAHKTLERGLVDIRTEISRRTRQGRTVEGGSMTPYAESTYARKADQGKSTTPNLTETGHMLRGMQSKVQRTKTGLLGQIYFLATEAIKAKTHHLGATIGRRKIPARPFFALSKQQLTQLIERIKEALK